jgi:predicted ArsR family transcriptional regulator
MLWKAERTAADTLVEQSDVQLDRDRFLRSLMRELAGTLESVVGLPETAGFISVVGSRIGDQIDTDYRRALKVSRLSRAQVSAVLIDLKRRIDGEFYVISEDDQKIVLGNRTCPFGDAVVGRPSLCMMTSNLFGKIAGENLGYAKVAIEESIAAGHAGCRVVVYVEPTAEAEAASGREYFSDTL